MKSELRIRFRALRDAMAPAARRDASERIRGLLQTWPGWERARTILAYASFGSEVDTTGWLPAWGSDRRVLLPRMEGRLLRLCEWHPDLLLAAGRFGIPEPPPSEPSVDASDVDLVIVPGLAFDRRGGRLGYGGGYYDRLLASIPHADRVGVAFDVQLVQTLPSTHLDQPMDAVVTPSVVNIMPRRNR